MNARRGDNGVPLGDVLDQLRRIVEVVRSRGPEVDADAVRDELGDDLAVRFPDYLSFLADAGCIDWDRRAGRIELGSRSDLAIDARPEWGDDVADRFDDVIADDAGRANRSAAESSDGEDAFGFETEEEVPKDAFEIAESSEIVELEEPAPESEQSAEPVEAAPETEQSEPDEADPAETPTGGEADETASGRESVESEHDPDRTSGPRDEGDAGETAASRERSEDASEDSDDALADTATGDEPADREQSGAEPETSEEETSSDARAESDDDADSEASDADRDDEASREERQSKSRKQDRRNESEEMARTSSSGDRYERIEEIGTGGLGTVYKGRHKPLDRAVAIKEISKIFDVFADLQRDEIIDRFREITRAQAQISHPSVAQIFDLHTDGEHPFSVTEYAPNGSLRRLIEDEEGRTLRVVLKYFIQLLHGLNAAHREDLVHGNIKPENVLLDASGNAKLSDFGLATLVDLEGASDQVYVGVGAVAYMAPEQFQNPNTATKRSDIYALGILFYEMLTGKVPGRRSPMPSSFFPEIPRSLDDIFDQMTMDDEEDRFGSIEEILQAFYNSDEIVELLDRQSGVVFLRDPIKYGDEPLVGEGDAGGEGSSDQHADTIQTDAAPVDEIEEEEDPETAEDSESSDDEGEESEADDEEAAAEETEAVDAAEENSEDEEGPPPEDAEDDEVLDKIDEYGEMFEEEEE